MKNVRQGKAALPPSAATATGALELLVRGNNRAARILASKVLAQPDCPAQDREEAEDVLGRIGLDRPTLAAALAASGVIVALTGMLIAA